MTLALEAAIVRFLIALLGTDAEEIYIAEIERDVLNLMGSSVPLTINQVNRVTLRIAALPAIPGTDIIRAYVTRMLRRLRRFYPVMVFAQCEGTGRGGPLIRARQRFTVERRGTPSFREQEESGVGGWLIRTRDRIRRLLGIRPAVIGAALANADRTSSYHMQIRGPEGSYLARQRIAEFPSGRTAELPHPQYAIRSRLGQRVSHIYIRDGEEFEGKYFVCAFFERMPGSLGNATMSAMGAALLIAIGAATRLGYGHLGSSNTDLVTVILAFPAIAGTWLGLEQSQSLYGGVLMARISLIITIVAALTSSAYYALGPADVGHSIALASRPGAAVWIVLVGVSATNLAACIGGWLLRANVESHFVKQRTPEMDDLGFDNV
jgi:hypothetical protein